MKCPFLLLLSALSPFQLAAGDRRSLYDQNGEFLPHVRLVKDLVEKYDHRVRPVLDHSAPTRVNFTMSLYQILAVNEKIQSVDLNLWVIQKWRDEFLGWDPNKYGGINTTILPHQRIWLPDTYLYNSMVMNREETERYINVVVSTDYWERRRGAQAMFMYPALYRVSCRIHIQYFPYDQQNCTLVIGSWTSDITSINYWPDSESVNLHSFIPNEEWEVISFEIRRVVEKFVCCSEPWVLLHASLVMRRKPLYYIVNLVLPTSVITLVAVTGFFTPASTSSERREKLSLGIDSVGRGENSGESMVQLLAMSILMMMVSEQMPTTSEYIPLFGLFYLSIIVIIFAGTLITALVLNVHLQKAYNRPIPPLISFIFFHKVAPWLGIRPSTVLMELWQETGVRIRGLNDSVHMRRRDIRKRTTTAGARHSLRKQQPMASTEASGRMIETTKKLPRPKSPHLPNNFLAPSDGSVLYQWRSNRALGGEEVSIGEWSIMERSIGEEEDESASANPRSGLTPEQSVRARRNWRRIAQRASAKHRDALERGRNLLEVTEGSQMQLDEDIPFADFSPGRHSMSPPPLLGSPVGTLSPKLPPPPPPPNNKNHRVSLASAAPPAKRPPPVPLGRQRSALGQSLAPSMPPALQLLLLPGGSKKDPSTSAAAVLDLKLRRRFAHEWEFLATVLDRVLLIVFAGLVVFVTGAMMAVGELILRSYPGSPEEESPPLMGDTEPDNNFMSMAAD